MIMGFLVLLGKRRKVELVMRVHRKKTYDLPDFSLVFVHPRSVDNWAGTSR